MNAKLRKYFSKIGARGGAAGKGTASRKRIASKAARARWSENRAKGGVPNINKD